jgi:hypothetical protein
VTREGLTRAGVWTIICFGLAFFWALSQVGDCGYGNGGCVAAQEHRRQVFLVAASLIWLSGLLFFLLRTRKR